MPRHTNAIGYLLDLRDHEGSQWFSKVCDLAVSSSGSVLSQSELESLLKILLAVEKYNPSSAIPSPLAISLSPDSPRVRYHLKQISNFVNFKRLSDGLKVGFDKRITILFGRNGSGKTSLCDAIKLLASPDAPRGPLHNVRIQSEKSPTFSYEFQSDATASTWESSKGFGLHSDKIKYFDSLIAIENVTGSPVPEKVVRIEPFRLEVFSYAGQYVRELANYISNLISSNREALAGAVEVVRGKFDTTRIPNEKAISNLTNLDCADLEKTLSCHVAADSTRKVNHERNVSALERLRSARTAEGLKLQQTELRVLRAYGRSIKKFIRLVKHVSLSQAARLKYDLLSLKNTQRELVKRITPQGIDLAFFTEFLRASQKVFCYDVTRDANCPFCRRPLDEGSLSTVKSYHGFLTNKVGDEIGNLESHLKETFSKLILVKQFSISTDTATVPLDRHILERSKDCIDRNRGLVPDHIEGLESRSPRYAEFGNVKEIEECISIIAVEVLQRYRAIRLASSTQETFEAQCNKLEADIALFGYSKCFDDNIEVITDVVNKIKSCNALEQILKTVGFPILLRKITNKSKEAYGELVVAEFQRSLDGEYSRMTGLAMADFGIALTRTGTDQEVKVDTKIGNEAITRILSEGEQKVHALALFFGEATVSKPDIVVFDDPVTSFDYNYSAQYAERLRDFISENPDVQVIVLTHNWDFFVHMQSIANRSGLNNETSVQVIEDCCIAEEYSEKIDDLKSVMSGIFAVAGEPPRAEKDRLAAFLRRLIEAIVNTHVFNNERHQFKQKSVAVSTFNSFTKVVPLLPAEAIKFRDLYARLSVPEHEDPRNYYTSISKAQYRQWYEDVCNIESAIISRRA